MFKQMLAIAGNTFLESIRQPIYFVLVLAGSLLQIFNLALSAYSMGYTEEGHEVSGDDKLLLDMGLATVLVVATLLASFIATNVLSREIENKTALTVISKPVGRPLFVLGKFLGVAGAITMAVVIMLAYFLLAIRHEVMSTARDEIDLPVVVFGGGAILLSVGVGIWCNYFYNWVFSSVATMLLAPLSVLAWSLTTVVGKDWAVLERTPAFSEWASEHAGLGAKLLAIPSMPPPTEWWKPEILLAALCVILAMLVLTAVAVAVSTRLGQVMTIVVSGGVFMLGLLSNFFLGGAAYQNEPIASVKEVALNDDRDDLTERGDDIVLTLDRLPDADLSPGRTIWLGSDPSGIDMYTANPRSFTGDLDDGTDLIDPDQGRAVIVRSFDSEERRLELVNAGGAGVDESPMEGDFVFITPTDVNPAALAAWSVIPNLQSFWLVDAITQGHPIPFRYVGLMIGYTATQVMALLGLAVLLFQTRDVG
jgi:ABC-type transport system involved in multi-copper enzyme maturation permease subunit